MGAPRFFVNSMLSPASVGTEVPLPDSVAHHALRVLRLGTGDSIILFTGDGGEYSATLTRVGKRDAYARLDAYVAADRESPLRIALVQAIASSDVMDAIVRHAVELGVAAIDPVVSARSARFPEGVQGEKRLAHWRQVAIAACEQCGRNRVPAVSDVIPLTRWCEQRDATGAGIVLDPEASADLRAIHPPDAGVQLLIGPEGGFTADEIARAERAGMHRVRLGPRVLRAETASLAALTAINFLWGDLR